METDTLFHEYFQLTPQALFELCGITPACDYHFSSPVFKASERRMDALLEPEVDDQPPYFVELQGYRDRAIYWRLLQQISMYYAQRPELIGKPWQAVVLFLDRDHDPGPETLGPLGQGDPPWLVRGV